MQNKLPRGEERFEYSNHEKLPNKNNFSKVMVAERVYKLFLISNKHIFLILC